MRDKKDRPNDITFSRELEEHLELFFEIDDIQVYFAPKADFVYFELFEGLDFINLDFGEQELII